MQLTNAIIAAALVGAASANYNEQPSAFPGSKPYTPGQPAPVNGAAKEPVFPAMPYPDGADKYPPTPSGVYDSKPIRYGDKPAEHKPVMPYSYSDIPGGYGVKPTSTMGYGNKPYPQMTSTSTPCETSSTSSYYSTKIQPTHIVEVLKEQVIVCVTPTTIVECSKTYTITTPTTLTIKDCPCTVTKPVTYSVVTVCNTW